MNPDRLIAFAEESFQNLLEAFFVSEYDDTALPSHGLDHHRRVWNYACRIIRTINLSPPTPHQDFVSGLILACYLHDIGMAADKGPRHGRLSRESAERFISNNGFDRARFTNALSAIENHDMKDYPDPAGLETTLKVLSLADDLDAMGFTGIYRYLEIYLKRGIEPREAGRKIAGNAASRFRFISESMQDDSRILEFAEIRYSVLESFFREFNSLAPTYDFGRRDPEGKCGIADVISQINSGDISLEEVIDKAMMGEPEKEISEFFKSLKDELDTPAFRS
jgi:HD superfamily phosphodiesterase